MLYFIFFNYFITSTGNKNSQAREEYLQNY